MIETEIEKLSQFVSSYVSLTKQIPSNDIAGIKNLLNAFEKKEQQLQEVMRQETPYYNIFEILKIRHYEAKVHTPFLAHLLDPKGSHHQGMLFLTRFFSDILRTEEDPEQFKKVSIKSERRNEFGQLDLEIWYTYKGIQKALVIENKIYHHDGDAQLYRYYQYLKAKRIDDCNLNLVYLTLSGQEPADHSMATTPKGCLKNVSYRKDITAWLTNCAESLVHNPVYHTIKQYLKTINSL